MHELGLARDFWDLITAYAKQHKVQKVTKIVIMVGEASGIDIGLLRHSFLDHILPGSIADGADLEIVRETLSAQCRDCGVQITAEKMTSLRCPGCGGLSVDIHSGKEAYVKSIEGT